MNKKIKIISFLLAISYNNSLFAMAPNIPKPQPQTSISKKARILIGGSVVGLSAITAAVIIGSIRGGKQTTSSQTSDGKNEIKNIDDELKRKIEEAIEKRQEYTYTLQFNDPAAMAGQMNSLVRVGTAANYSVTVNTKTKQVILKPVEPANSKEPEKDPNADIEEVTQDNVAAIVSRIAQNSRKEMPEDQEIPVGNDTPQAPPPPDPEGPKASEETPTEPEETDRTKELPKETPATEPEHLTKEENANAGQISPNTLTLPRPVPPNHNADIGDINRDVYPKKSKIARWRARDCAGRTEINETTSPSQIPLTQRKVTRGPQPHTQVWGLAGVGDRILQLDRLKKNAFGEAPALYQWTPADHPSWPWPWNITGWHPTLARFPEGETKQEREQLQALGVCISRSIQARKHLDNNTFAQLCHSQKLISDDPYPDCLRRKECWALAKKALESHPVIAVWLHLRPPGTGEEKPGETICYLPNRESHIKEAYNRLALCAREPEINPTIAAAFDLVLLLALPDISKNSNLTVHLLTAIMNQARDEGMQIGPLTDIFIQRYNEYVSTMPGGIVSMGTKSWILADLNPTVFADAVNKFKMPPLEAIPPFICYNFSLLGYSGRNELADHIRAILFAAQLNTLAREPLSTTDAKIDILMSTDGWWCRHGRRYRELQAFIGARDAALRHDKTAAAEEIFKLSEMNPAADPTWSPKHDGDNTTQGRKSTCYINSIVQNVLYKGLACLFDGAINPGYDTGILFTHKDNGVVSRSHVKIPVMIQPKQGPTMFQTKPKHFRALEALLGVARQIAKFSSNDAMRGDLADSYKGGRASYVLEFAFDAETECICPTGDEREAYSLVSKVWKTLHDPYSLCFIDTTAQPSMGRVPKLHSMSVVDIFCNVSGVGIIYINPWYDQAQKIFFTWRELQESIAVFTIAKFPEDIVNAAKEQAEVNGQTGLFKPTGLPGFKSPGDPKIKAEYDEYDEQSQSAIILEDETNEYSSENESEPDEVQDADWEIDRIESSDENSDAEQPDEQPSEIDEYLPQQDLKANADCTSNSDNEEQPSDINEMLPQQETRDISDWTSNKENEDKPTDFNEMLPQQETRDISDGTSNKENEDKPTDFKEIVPQQETIDIADWKTHPENEDKPSDSNELRPQQFPITITVCDSNSDTEYSNNQYRYPENKPPLVASVIEEDDALQTGKLSGLPDEKIPPWDRTATN
ncbi:MAG: hypothetical protein NkDv07_0690 [Candidatus Improbicoccus devescovinae]|nr:MAG: hypothetical protein NkDv07_0690 [Candidatus Improbicoccus devescovinae]